MNQRLKKYQKKLTILYAALLVVLLIGVSFAIFQNFARQSGTNNIGATNCFSVTFEGVNNAINLANDYPIPDDEGLEREPYTFKVTNNCDQYLSLSIGVETLSASEIPSNLIKGVIIESGETPTNASILSSGKTMEAQNGGVAYELLTDGLSANSSKTYDLRLWFDESMTKEQGASKKYQGKVIVGASANIKPQNRLSDVILANNEIKQTITTPSKEISAYSFDDVETKTMNVTDNDKTSNILYGTGWEANGNNFNLTGVDISASDYSSSYGTIIGKYIASTSIYENINGSVKQNNLNCVYYVINATTNSFNYKELCSNKNTTEALLASTEDDYGTSYYFRGTVKNNYIQFANKCWRIVRITGNGAVKLVLHNDNTSNLPNPCLETNNDEAAFAHFNGTTYISAYNMDTLDNAYIGFMYGKIGSSDYTSTHTNTNKSTILTNLETWYKNNLLEYDDKIADVIWCNDKSTTDVATGYSSINSTYQAANRITTLKSPSLICPNDNNGGKLSKFTVSDTTNGNGNLTHKIGMLTADELAFAGYAENYTSLNTYLQENTGNNQWWTLSPSLLYVYNNNRWATMWTTYFTSKYNGLNASANKMAVRPAISLSANVSVTGNGTSENPYVVE